MAGHGDGRKDDPQRGSNKKAFVKKNRTQRRKPQNKGTPRSQ